MEKSLAAVNAEEDYQAIRKAIDALNQGTTRLAELMMDTAVSTALKGKNMDDADLSVDHLGEHFVELEREAGAEVAPVSGGALY